MNDPLNFDSFMPGQQQMSRPNLRFFTEAVELPGKSIEEGRAVYVDRDMVAITNPGARDEVVRRAEDKAKQDQYVAWAYDQWKKTKAQPTDGTPLDMVPFLKPSQIKELQHINVMSLENLAGMSDVQAQRAGINGAELVRKAKAYLQSAKDSAIVMKLESQLTDLRRDNDALKEQIRQINARFEAMNVQSGKAA